MPATMTIDKLGGDALFILKSIKENARQGRATKLADAKLVLESQVSLEFDSYFFFLRKFHYLAMDREAQLKLTEQGEQVVEGDQGDRFTQEIAEFFREQLEPGLPDHTLLSVAPAIAPLTDLPLENTMPQPPSRGGSRKPTPDDLLAPPQPPAPVPLPLTAAISAPTAPRGQDLDLRYQKNEQLGQGPLGTVFKGRHNALGLEVCVKELKDIFGYFSFLQRGEVIKRLKRELCAQAQVRHPGVVQVLDQNTDVARPYYVMELCRGTLREKLDSLGGSKGIPVDQAMRYFLQLAYALRAAHQQGLTHHNLKPENVLFDAFGNAKLSDFGLSRVIEVDASKGMPQVFVGTGGMGYMSPELISRGKEIGPASDVYGLGILLYEMLTGQLPGRRSPLPSEINAEVPAALDPIFDKMTQDRKETRYPDFEAVFDDFYSAFADRTYLDRGDLILWSELG
jgi:eukaryotic-like serine/threonine-protein kinase